MKILVDMNLSPRWAHALAGNGIEATHRSKLGPVDAPDAQIMAYAREHDYVVLTHDLDFSAMLAATRGQNPAWSRFAPTMSALMSLVPKS